MFTVYTNAARVHVVKADPSSDNDIELGPQMQGTGSTNAKGKGKGKGKGKEKKKSKGNGQGNAGGNQQHSKKGQQGQGAHGHNPQRRQRQQHQQSQHPHPDGQRSGPAPGQSKRQKRKATATTNGAADDGEHATTNDDDRPAAKRHKKERDSERGGRPPSPGPSAARAHPDFWHPDGSVVVEVEETKFRLHQSTLQKHSAYFAAAFREKEAARQRGGRAFLEVEVDERSLGHLPVYRVAETTADDFSRLLTVIEEPMKYADETPPMPFLAGVLRAARALSFDVQRKWAERMFERMWPPTLDTLTADAVPHAAVALALARNCGLRGVQKRASYELLRIPTFGQSITGAARANAGTGADADADTNAGADADVRLGELSRTELLRLLHAREQLNLAWAEVAGTAPTDFPCPRNTQACASADVDRVHVRWAELVHTTGLYAQRMVDPLMGLQDLVEIPWKDEGFCKKCVLARRNVWDELRRKLWDDLDVWLELTR